MSALAKYNPLKTISIPGAEIAEPQGIIVVVGPNSSGKTLFLRDIENYLLTGVPSFVVCEGLTPQRPDDYQAFVNDLIERNYMQPVPGGQAGTYKTYVPFMKQAEPNAQNIRQPFTLPALRKAYDGFVSESKGDNRGWFGTIGITLAALLSLDQRRHVCKRVNSFDYKQGTPDHPLQGLFINSEAQARLAEETGKVFGDSVWLDISENGTYQLRSSGSRQPPPHGEMNNPLQARHYHPIESEGDGYRSYVGICLSLLLATRPVSLIDEPELCLHPPQAYHIGRFIGQFAQEEHVTLIATHSSHVLRGILETGKMVKVIRLTRRKREFSGRLIAERELVDNLRNPRTRAEAILDGVFSKGVVLVEGEGDREEYQAASEAIDDYPSREIHFVPVGGTGGFAGPLRFYRSLGIPVAIIADLDVVCDTDKMITLTRLLIPESSGTEEIVGLLRTVVQQIKALPPPVTEHDAKERLKRLSEESWNWKDGGDNSLRRQLNELEGQLKRIQKLKEGGIAAYQVHADIHAQLLELIARYASIGLFFVPVGELEDWVKPLMADVARTITSKSERAGVAANRIREVENKSGDIWEFVRKVLDYLRGLGE